MDPEDKIKRLEAMLQTETEDALTHFLLGREYMEVGRNDDAAKTLSRCVELNPQYTAAYRYLGDAHRHSGNLDKAREAYEVGIGVANETGDIQAGKEMQVLLKRLKA